MFGGDLRRALAESAGHRVAGFFGRFARAERRGARLIVQLFSGVLDVTAREMIELGGEQAGKLAGFIAQGFGGLRQSFFERGLHLRLHFLFVPFGRFENRFKCVVRGFGGAGLQIGQPADLRRGA